MFSRGNKFILSIHSFHPNDFGNYRFASLPSRRQLFFSSTSSPPTHPLIIDGVLMVRKHLSSPVYFQLFFFFLSRMRTSRGKKLEIKLIVVYSR
jgi:hypothetical protein